MIKKAIILLGLLIVFFSYFKFRSIDTFTKIELEILKEFEPNFFMQELKFIPNNIDARFRFKLFKSEDQRHLFSVIYHHKDVYLAYYYLIESNEKIRRIKDSFLKTNSTGDRDISNLISLKDFNFVSKEFDIESDSLIKDTFCFILARYSDRKYSSKITNISDYNKIIKLHELKIERYQLLSPLIRDEELKQLLNNRNTNEYYYWYIDRGVFKFHFEIKNNIISSVTSEFIGYLGNERIHF